MICPRVILTLLALLVARGAFAVDSDVSHPNLVLVLADDLAWADLGCYGHRWHDTPHLDRLAAEGMRFTNAYSAAPICSASRASLLTGKTTARLGFEFVTKNEPGFQQLDAKTPLRAPALTLNLPLEEITIAETLRIAGYETAFFGKWHLNAHHERYLGWSPTYGPQGQGFQFAVEDFGGHPYSWGKKQTKIIREPAQFPADSMVDRACNYLRDHHDDPYFAMISHFYVHTPVKTPCSWLIEKYEALIPVDTPARERRVRYAAFVETLDHYVGELLDAIEESGVSENTLVVFTSDNGGHPEFTANGPLRGSKWNLYEGGIRVPLLVRWPGHIPHETASDQPVIGYDLHATFAAAASTRVGNTDGTSLLPIMTENESLPDRPLIWHFPYYHPERGFAKAPSLIGINDFKTSRTRPHSAMRFGRNKVLRFYEDDSVEVYDLQNDPSEQQDLSAANDALARELAGLMNQTLMKMHARYPTPVRD
ncbi:MAG: sulfatase [Planctomycetota bacterium]